MPAWLPTQNYLNRLARLPKHPLADPALAASILGFDADALLKGAEAGPLWLREKIGADLLDTVVINTGPEAYRRKDGTAVIPAALLGP